MCLSLVHSCACECEVSGYMSGTRLEDPKSSRKEAGALYSMGLMEIAAVSVSVTKTGG